MAEKLGISPQAITDAKRKNRIPETWFDIVTDKFGVTKDELCQQDDKKIGATVPFAQDFFPPQIQGTEEIIHRKQAEKDGYDQIMDEFFELVKEWQIEENGRSARTAIDFIQEFPKRFGEMVEWQKKRKSGNFQDQFPEIKSANGNE